MMISKFGTSGSGAPIDKGRLVIGCSYSNARTATLF